MDDADRDAQAGGDGADGLAACSSSVDGGAFVVVDDGGAPADPARTAEILTGSPTDTTAEHPLLHALARYHHARRAARHRACAAAGIDPTGAAAMHEIILAEQQHDPLTPGQLARILAITIAATTTLIDRLVRADLITRTPHLTDGRKTLLRTNPAALPELQAAKATITRTAQTLNDHDAALITTFLNNLSTTLEN